jgi:hypothetical protein
MTEHSERYWEARWRDEKAANERLLALLVRARQYVVAAGVVPLVTEIDCVLPAP